MSKYMNELTKAANEAMLRLAAEYKVVATNRPTREVWAEIHSAKAKAAAKYRLPVGHTTIIFGRSDRVAEIMKERGVPCALSKSFEGGYDDYDGSMCWAEVPGYYVGGPVRRFSPNPGRWIFGVRV